MAFFGRVRGIIQHTLTKHINQDISASRPSILQAIRCMSQSKLFVGGTFKFLTTLSIDMYMFCIYIFILQPLKFYVSQVSPINLMNLLLEKHLVNMEMLWKV